MIDLTTIDPDTLMARGQYSTIRAAHEDAKKRLAVLCGLVNSTSAQVLRALQPDNDASPDMEEVNALLANMRATVEKVAACVVDIEGLAMQRKALKPVAWGDK